MNFLRIPKAHGDILFTRAWPIGEPDDLTVSLRVEGRDTDGNVRAGTLELSRAGEIVDVAVPPVGVDEKLPALAEVNGELISHRFGKRAVVRHGELYVKVVRESAGERLAERNVLGAALAQQAGLLSAAPTLTAPGVLVSEAIPGRSLHRVEHDGKLWGDAWLSFVDRWPDFVRVETDAVPAHTPEDEAKVLVEWIEGAVARGVLDDDSGAARKAAQRIGEQLVTGRADAPLLAHRDLHDAQLLHDDASDRIGILDLDTLAMAEPSLDLGNLAVHAILRVAQGHWRQAQGDVVVHAVSELVESLGVTPARLQLAQSATALRLAAVYAYRPRWQEFAQQWLSIWLTKPVLR